jgi:uncharacterized protein with NAD-binding domain and iron-sulfur cluster
MKKDIIIIGAGISGLTVAHSLIKKGYNVNVYEKSDIAGGMARSMRDKNNVPTEHSWRGYAPFYHNLFKLLKEIPLQTTEGFNLYTKEEVKKHNTIEDLWTYYKGNVYDLTDFIKDHPGGNIIMHAGGKDLEEEWKEHGYEWHANNKSVIKLLEKYKIGKLVENMTEPKTVYDNLNHSKVKFMLLSNQNSNLDESIKLSIRDYIFLFILFGRVITSDERRKEYFKIRLDPIIKKYLSHSGYLFITYFMAGPGYGFDKNTMTLGHFGLFAYFSLRENHELWKVMSKPTNEAWIDPWVSYLKNQGVKFHFNHELTEIINNSKNECIGLIINNKIKKLNPLNTAYCLSLNPFILEDILRKSKNTKLVKKLESGNIVNNQISFRLGFSKKINFGAKNLGFVLIDSEYNITFYNQEDHWNKDIELGMDGKIKTLISGTLILPYNNGSLYKTSALNLKKDELIKEIINQFKKSKHFNKLISTSDTNDPEAMLLSNSPLVNDPFNNIIYTEIFEDWIESNSKIQPSQMNNRLTSKNLKWVNNSINEEHRLSQHYPLEYKNVFISGSHTKTSINIWSMEGAVESGLLTTNKILKYFGNNNMVSIYNHEIGKIYAPLHILDNSLYSYGLPNIIDVLFCIILFYLIKYYKNNLKH